MDVPAAQAWPSPDRPRTARTGRPARAREPALGLPADRRRADQAWLSPLTEHGPACAYLRWTRSRAAARSGELAGVPLLAGRQHARLRLLHRRDNLPAPPLRALLHRTRKPARPLRRLHDEPIRSLGRATGAQPQLHRPLRADALPDPRSRYQVHRFLRRGFPQRRNHRDPHARASAAGERIRGTVRSHRQNGMSRLAPDRWPPPPRTRPAHLHPALQPRTPAPRTRAPAAPSATAQATDRRRGPAPRPPRRPRARVLQSRGMSEHGFDTLQEDARATGPSCPQS